MFLSKAAFGFCVLFLICTVAAQIVASKNGDTRRLHGLRLIGVGLILSACAYLCHILAISPESPVSILGIVLRLGGTVFLYLAWKDHWMRQRERLSTHPLAVSQEKDEGHQFAVALPPGYAALYSGLNSRAREALCAAQEEALKRGRCCVDTDHLLLGLLDVPQCAASRILEHSHIPAERLTRELARQADMAGQSEIEERLPPKSPALTHRARQVLVMAEMEAHRFDKTFIGTEHLLLGLLLIGSGPAASTLFGAGMTVDGIRREVIAGARETPP